FLAGLRNPGLYFVAGALQSGKFKGLAKFGTFEPAEVMKLAEDLGVLRGGWVGRSEEIADAVVKPSKNLLSDRGPWARLGQKVGSAVEDNARLALFLDGLQQGLDPQSAAWRVKKYLFDYGALATVEKAVWRRLVPFYSWTRFSIPLAIESMITQPGKVGIL